MYFLKLTTYILCNTILAKCYNRDIQHSSAYNLEFPKITNYVYLYVYFVH